MVIERNPFRELGSMIFLLADERAYSRLESLADPKNPNYDYKAKMRLDLLRDWGETRKDIIDGLILYVASADKKQEYKELLSKEVFSDTRWAVKKIKGGSEEEKKRAAEIINLGPNLVLAYDFLKVYNPGDFVGVET
jgi:hypothetical protein